MTAEGEGVAARAIRVRLDGMASDSDVGALKKWLERRGRLQQLVKRGDLRIEERAGTDEQGTPMGVGMDIVLVLIGRAPRRSSGSARTGQERGTGLERQPRLRGERRSAGGPCRSPGFLT